MIKVKLILAVLAFGLLFGAGWKTAEWRCEAAKAKVIAKAKAWEEKARAAQREAAEKILAAQRKRRVIIREKIREIPKYINVGECRVTDAGMSELADILRPTDSATEPD